MDTLTTRIHNRRRVHVIPTLTPAETAALKQSLADEFGLEWVDGDIAVATRG